MFKLKRVKELLTVFFLITLLMGCAPVSFAKTPPTFPLESIGDAPNFANEEPKEWTMIQYHDADNDLGRYAYSDLLEMMITGSNENVNLVVLYDTYGAPPSSYYIEKGGALLIEAYPEEVDMGDPTVLTEFIKMAMENYPAKKYLLNIWDHGDDFLGSCRDYHKGPGQLEGEHGFLFQTELLSAIQEHIASTGKLDILCFDACIESMIEVAYDYRLDVSYLVASEDYVPYWGLPYDTILKDLEANPTADAGWVSRKIVNDYMEEYLKPNGNGALNSGGGSFPTYSAIDLKQTDSFVTNLETIATKLSSNVKTYKGMISSARAKAILNMPITGWDADIDLYTFVDKVSSVSQETGFQDAVNGIKSAWIGEDAFIYTKCCDQYAAKSAYGLGIYFPPSRGCLIHNTLTDAEYYFGQDSSGEANVPFASTEWGNFLKTYFDLQP